MTATSQPTLIEICRSGNATRREIDAAINRAAMILGGGDAVLLWSAIGNGEQPSDARRIEMARELLDSALHASCALTEAA